MKQLWYQAWWNVSKIYRLEPENTPFWKWRNIDIYIYIHIIHEAAIFFGFQMSDLGVYRFWLRLIVLRKG